MYGVCIPKDINSWEQNQWSFVLSHWKPDKIYLVGDGPGELKGADCIDTVPSWDNTVLLAPPNGYYFKGQTSLSDFEHPEDCLYIFGSNHHHLSTDYLGDAQITDSVYIPTDGHAEMYSFVAAAVVFYDRMVGRG